MEPPTFLKCIGDTELYKSMTAKFTACATGIPEATVECFHNDKIFPINKNKNGKRHCWVTKAYNFWNRC